MKLLIHSQTSTIAPLKFGYEIRNFNSYWAYDYFSMLGLKLIHFSKRDQILFRLVRFDRFVLFVLGDLVICLHGYTWASLGQGLCLIGKVLFSYSIHVIFELFEAFDLRATFVISIINICWLYWIINRLIVMHPYALSHSKAVLNWKHVVWSIGLILISSVNQGFRQNKPKT